MGGDRRPDAPRTWKIQDGCNNRCSFCIIPFVRGRSRSLPLADVLKQIRGLSQAGYREVVLSGINLAAMVRRDLDTERGGKCGFAQLIRSILEETPIERLRLSSVEPMDFTDDLLDLMASSPRIAKHIHAPLQSGSIASSASCTANIILTITATASRPPSRGCRTPPLART